MIRKIIQISEEKCNGCGLCAGACHEGAIGIIEGKARLLRDDYCDGLGDCLPACPTGAISFVEREADDYDSQAVIRHQAEAKRRTQQAVSEKQSEQTVSPAVSRLSQWPVQLKLAPINAPYYADADLLVAADCTAYAYGMFHETFMNGKVTLIGCPKLDAADYSEKLSGILVQNKIKSLTVARMEVPCCGGIEYAAAKALASSKSQIPFQIFTISTDGSIL